YCGTQPICNAGSNSTGCTTACTLGSAPTYYGYYCPPVVVPEKSCTTGTHLTGTPGTQNCSMVCEAKGGLYISNTQWNSENNTVLNCCCKNVVAPATDTPQGLYPQNNNGRTEGMACCFLQKGKVRIYASATARANNGMNTPCTDAVYGNTYGATRWFECPNDTVDGGAQADYETANTPVPTTCTVTDTGKVIPKDEKFHCISNVEFARCDAQNNAVVTHCGGNLTCQVGEGAWGDGCANPEVAVSPIVSPVVSPVVDPASNCELLSANCGAGNAHYQGVDTFSYYKSKSTACASVSTTSNQACYSYSSPTSCNEVTWGNIDTHYCVEGAPITLPTACPGTNINCNDQSGVCGAAGGDTGQSYYKTNASPYNIIDGATCKPKTETEMKTICKCKTAAVVDSNVTIACQRYTCTEACSTVSKTCPFNDCNTRIVHKSNQGIWFDDSTCNTYPLGANVEDITKCMCTAPQVAAAPTVSNDAKCVTATGIAQSYCGNTGGGCGTYGFGPNNGYQCSSSFWGTAYCCTPNLVMIVINNKCTNSMTVGATSRFSKTIAAGGSDYVSTETMTSINVVIYRVAGAYSSKSFSPSTSGYVLNLEGDYCN
ncbi:MAG: hypothetical protein NTZ55_01630, partial [Candidatus Roizmanbacteria bacterium]|nr:hypothetical protein [Candidatus Roizmanbacteria bacterium]